MNKQCKIALLLSLLSLVLLIPGLTQPIITIKMDAKVETGFANFESNSLDKTRSIIGTVKDLIDSQNEFVAFLIFFFSVLIPFIKFGLVVFSVLTKTEELKQRLFSFVYKIGKWSMADVFVVGIFIAFLSTRNQGVQETKQLSIMGMNLAVSLGANMSSSLGPGFYYFLGYCLVSLLALQSFKFETKVVFKT